MSIDAPIYLDYCATTPCDQQVIEEMLPYFNQFFGNASSRAHSYGWKADAAVEQARERVAMLVNAQPREIIFTSGATEACNLALRGVFDLYSIKGNHIITSKTEHKAVLDTCKALEKKGASVTYLDVNQEGLISLEALTTAIQPNTILVSIMYANNETGVIQPIKEIGALCKQHQILFFCDATQAVGKIPVDVLNDDIDLMSFSSHKMYGPKGIGALYIRSRNPRVKLAPQITGGGQEQNIRCGTLNVPSIVGFGKACQIAQQTIPTEFERLFLLKNQLETGLLTMPNVFVNGHKQWRLPHVSNISFAGFNSSMLLSSLNKHLALSSGSACTSGSLDPSYVLTAMGIEKNLAKAALRFSLGRWSTEQEVKTTVQTVISEIAKHG